MDQLVLFCAVVDQIQNREGKVDDDEEEQEEEEGVEERSQLQNHQ